MVHQEEVELAVLAVRRRPRWRSSEKQPRRRCSHESTGGPVCSTRQTGRQEPSAERREARLCGSRLPTARSKSGSSSGMAFFRQAFGSLTADDCADWRLRISVPTSSHGSSRVHWKGRTRSSKHSATLECFLKNDKLIGAEVDGTRPYRLRWLTLPASSSWVQQASRRKTALGRPRADRRGPDPKCPPRQVESCPRR